MKRLKSDHLIPIILVSAATVYLLTHIFPLIKGKSQHDFRTYYYSTKAYYEGLDPYDLKSLQQISGNNLIDLPFTYPPYCFKIFKPFTFLSYFPAYYLFLLAKLSAILLLVYIWTRVVTVGKENLWMVYVTIVFGYRSAIYRDLNAGNVSTFEQVAIWTGILLMMRGRVLFGGVSIVLSSVFKLITITLLPLLVTIRRSWYSVCLTLTLACISICAYFLAYTNNPHMWLDFFNVINSIGCTGNTCPSSLALLHDFSASALISDTSIYYLYGLLCVVILSLLIWSFLITRSSTDRYPLLYLTIIAYVILAPRMKDYSLIIALLPTIHTICSMTFHRWQACLGFILLWIHMVDYQTLLTAVFTFYLIINWIWKNRNNPDVIIKPIQDYRF